MKTIIKAVLLQGSISVLAVFFSSTLGWAEVTTQAIEDLIQSNKELSARIVTLESEISVLKGRMVQVENAPKTTSMTTSRSQEGGAVKTPSGDVSLSGFVDTSFNWNFRNPEANTGSPAVTTNGNSPLRAFDKNSNTFDLNNVELILERPAPEKGGAGFKVVTMYGTDAQSSDASGFNTSDEFAIQQAYAALKIPIGSGLMVWAGKFATLHGAEVIENYLNWNASRSFLFNLAIPFTHTGARAFYHWFGGKLTTTVGLVNGWDQAIDINNMKDIETQIKWTPNESLSVSSGFMVGSQVANDSKTPRGLIDNVVTWTPLPKSLPKLKLMANYDYGWDKGMAKDPTFSALTSESGVADWQGYALYGRYELLDWLAFGARWEQFWDDQGARVYLAGDPFATGAELQSLTYTTDIKIYRNLLTRLEYRHDFADGKAFQDQNKKNQDTAGASMIYVF